MNENQNIEWKETWRDEYLKWICGFANAKGGKIIIGRNDKGEYIGIKNSHRLMEDIPNKIQTHLGIICDVDLKDYNGKEYIQIDIKPSEVPISYQGKYHYRSGSTKQVLKGNGLNNFLLKKIGRTWDDVIETRATMNDIDENAVEAFKKEALESKRLPFINEEKNLKQILDNLLLLEGTKLKRAAVLLFGKNPNRFYVNAFVKIGRFGESDDDLLFQEIIEGNIFELPNKVVDILDKKFLVSKISYIGIHRLEKWEYPYEAVREAIINAIIHKDYMGAPVQIRVYDDKIMFWNEGTLPEGITIADLKSKHTSRPHNPIMAGVFFKAGLIEAWGRGTIKILNECKKAGLPEPAIENISGGISVTFFSKYYNFRPSVYQVADQLTDQVTDQDTDQDTDQVADQVVPQNIKKLLVVINGEMSRAELMTKLKLKHSFNFRKNYLEPSIRFGFIEMTIPDKPNSKNQKYRLTRKGKQVLMEYK